MATQRSFEMGKLAGVRYESKIITPDVARSMLATSAGNRPIGRRRVGLLIEAMKAGTWASHNGEAIKMSPEGHLVDGHHRLTAIVVSGTTVTMDVAYGAHGPMDEGKSRSPGDIAQMTHGIKNANNSMAVVSATIMLALDVHASTNDERIAVYRAHPFIEEMLATRLSILRTDSSTVAAAFAFASGGEPDFVRVTLEKYVSREGLSMTMASLARMSSSSEFKSGVRRTGVYEDIKGNGRRLASVFALTALMYEHQRRTDIRVLRASLDSIPYWDRLRDLRGQPRIVIKPQPDGSAYKIGSVIKNARR